MSQRDSIENIARDRNAQAYGEDLTFITNDELIVSETSVETMAQRQNHMS
jgi:hypothetical protein